MLLYLDGGQSPDLCVQTKTDWHLVCKASCETESQFFPYRSQVFALREAYFPEGSSSLNPKISRNKEVAITHNRVLQERVEEFCLHPSLDLASMS